MSIRSRKKFLFTIFQKKKKSGRMKTGDSEENIEAVRQPFTQSPMRPLADTHKSLVFHSLSSFGSWGRTRNFIHTKCRSSILRTTDNTEMLGDRVISFKTEHIWSLHSADLNPLDFFLWGYTKDIVYKDTPRNIQQHKRAIEECGRSISPRTCKRVTQNFTVRVNTCLASSGGHIKRIIQAIQSL